MKESKNTTCTPCEQNFERNIDEIVREGKTPTAQERQRREEDVKSAFDETKTAKK